MATVLPIARDGRGAPGPRSFVEPVVGSCHDRPPSTARAAGDGGGRGSMRGPCIGLKGRLTAATKGDPRHTVSRAREDRSPAGHSTSSSAPSSAPNTILPELGAGVSRCPRMPRVARSASPCGHRVEDLLVVAQRLLDGIGERQQVVRAEQITAAGLDRLGEPIAAGGAGERRGGTASRPGGTRCGRDVVQRRDRVADETRLLSVCRRAASTAVSVSSAIRKSRMSSISPVCGAHPRLPGRGGPAEFGDVRAAGGAAADLDVAVGRGASLIASRRLMRATPSCSASSRSGGSRPPGPTSPRWIRCGGGRRRPAPASSTSPVSPCPQATAPVIRP